MRFLKKLSWLWNRLKCMPISELGYRIYQKGYSTLQRYCFFTAIQPPEPLSSDLGNNWLKMPVAVNLQAYTEKANRILGGRLRVFAVDYKFNDRPRWNYDVSSGKSTPLAFGKSLDYRDPDQFGDIKYVWEPNRHLHLVTLAQGFALTGGKHYGDALTKHLFSWLEQCPYPLGANWISSLELGIRLINWSIAWQLIDSTSNSFLAGPAGKDLKEQWLRSIYQHCHFIDGHWSRYSSANNHLIGEAAGLFVASVTWPYWPESAKWRAKAKTLLTDEALRQNYDDGVNKEQAISYQQFVLDFLLFAGLAARAGGQDFPEAYWNRVEKMIEFIASIMDVSGHMPMIGDADDGYVSQLSQESDFCPYRSLLATGAVLFNRADFKAKAGTFDDKSRWLLGDGSEALFASLDDDKEKLPVHSSFTKGGYYILGTDFETDSEVKMLADAGALGYLSIAAHGHADALAITLSVGGREFLIDPGTYAYHTQKKWRDYFRGTSAHNTVRIDGLDQSVPGGNFMWIKHAHAECIKWQDDDRATVFLGKQDGYARLTDPLIHSRLIELDKQQKSFLIKDTLECKQAHTAERFWHFSEHCVVSVGQDSSIMAENAGYKIIIKPLQDVTANVYRGDEAEPLGWVSRRYDVKEPTTTVVWTNAVNGTCEIGALIDCKLS